MKKIRKIYLVLLSLILVVSIGIISFTHEKNGFEHEEGHVTLPHFIATFDEEKMKEHLTTQISHGDYSDIQGHWKTESNLEYDIEGSNFILGQQSYYMVKGGIDEYGIPYIKTDNHRSAKLYFYAAGQPIPTLQEDGSVIVSDMADPSDNSKNRLLFAQTILTPEQVKENVSYQTAEE